MSAKKVPSLFFVNISIKCSPNSKSFQFWNLLVLRISKLSLIFNFGQVEVEILGLEHTRGHFQFFTFLNEDMRNYPVLTVLITQRDSQNLPTSVVSMFMYTMSLVFSFTIQQMDGQSIILIVFFSVGVK